MPDGATGKRIVGLRRREDTILRLGGNGDNFHMTWTADDRQFVAVDDGAGWPDGAPAKTFNSRLWAIRGGPEDAGFEDVPGYPELPTRPWSEDGTTWPRDVPPWYFSFGTLAVGEDVYQFLSTDERTEMLWDLLFVGAKLIHSPDNGRTWCNQDGSTPVRWESWEERSRQTMAFFREPQDAFSVLSILQMGRAYRQNRDGYVYVYGANGSDDGEINQLVMFRVRVDRVLDRSSYRFFGGLRADGTADWVADIADRAVVQEFPRGHATPHAHTWVPSVVYLAAHDVYLMANWGMAWLNPGEEMGARPSYLGFWTSPTPWGPWTQIHEETEWLPGGDSRARAYEAQIAPKWIAPDGSHFWLVWTDLQPGPDPAAPPPYYSFNTQRVDLILE